MLKREPQRHGSLTSARVRLRQGDRDQPLVVLLAQSLETIGIDGHVVALPEPLGKQPIEKDIFVAETVTLKIGLVGRQCQIEAAAPSRAAA